ncbi:MAG: hypothetical protein KVP17_001618, partial [Porospora cf. gigantea B]|uniref:uncharacterized protein n=1 Tax=Porospora cf. gigantea B TaxID=2853592 RepID=UPI003571A5EA
MSLPGLTQYPEVPDCSDVAFPDEDGPTHEFLRKGSKKPRTFLKTRSDSCKVSGSKKELDSVARSLNEAKASLLRLIGEGVDVNDAVSFMSQTDDLDFWSDGGKLGECGLVSDLSLKASPRRRGIPSPVHTERQHYDIPMRPRQPFDDPGDFPIDDTETDCDGISPLTASNAPVVGRKGAGYPSRPSPQSVCDRIWEEIDENLDFPRGDYPSRSALEAEWNKVVLRQKMLDAREHRIRTVEEKLELEYEQLRDVAAREEMWRSETSSRLREGVDKEKRKLHSDREAFRARIEKANVLISENRDLRAHIDSLQQDLSVSTGDAARVRQQMLSVRSRMESLETENRQLQREASLLRERETSSRIRVKSSPPGERRQGPTPRSHPPVLMTELRAQNRENKRTSLEPINTESTLTESLRNNLGGASPPSIPPSSTPSVSSFGDMKAADREIETFLRAYDRAAELSWVASVLSRRE